MPAAKRIKKIFDSVRGMPRVNATVPGTTPPITPASKNQIARLVEEFDRLHASFTRPQQAALADGEIVVGRYRVEGMIGRGGMGEVYEVYDPLLRESMALKTMRADLSTDETYIHRFQKEIQLARKVTHPNVCRVYDVGVHEAPGSDRGPLLFFTM